MRDKTIRLALLMMLLPAALLVAACDDSAGPGLSKDDPSDDDDDDDDPSDDFVGGENIDPVLSQRKLDYNEALRTASLKLLQTLPTLAQIRKVQLAEDPARAYEEELDAMFADPRFDARMVKFWRDTMRQGGGDLDSAPVLAAKIMAEGRPYTDLFTQTTGTCPTYDGETGVFTDADCDNGVAEHAGVLTNPAVMKHFYGNMAFRRVRWVQEIFLCTKFPAEIDDSPTQIEGKDYTSPWPFESIATEPIDFQDAESVVCANCHTTMNHVAPLFGNFDADGNWQDAISVVTPVVPEAPTEFSHWLKPGELPSWRFGEKVASLPELGQVLASDPAVTECAVARMWNFAMSKEDIVSDLANVPYPVIEPFIEELSENDFDLKATLRLMMLSEDFVSF